MANAISPGSVVNLGSAQWLDHLKQQQAEGCLMISSKIQTHIIFKDQPQRRETNRASYVTESLPTEENALLEYLRPRFVKEIGKSLPPIGSVSEQELCGCFFRLPPDSPTRRLVMRTFEEQASEEQVERMKDFYESMDALAVRDLRIAEDPVLNYAKLIMSKILCLPEGACRTGLLNEYRAGMEEQKHKNWDDISACFREKMQEINRCIQSQENVRQGELAVSVTYKKPTEEIETTVATECKWTKTVSKYALEITTDLARQEAIAKALGVYEEGTALCGTMSAYSLRPEGKEESQPQYFLMFTPLEEDSAAARVSMVCSSMSNEEERAMTLSLLLVFTLQQIKAVGVSVFYCGPAIGVACSDALMKSQENRIRVEHFPDNLQAPWRLSLLDG